MSDFMMDLPSSVLFILDRMKESGFSAHVVGGSVRDALLGRKCGDFDITTNALPEETKAVFKGCRIIETGIKHGTVSLLLDGITYEITTYRIDGDYKDNRHPESVTFTSLLDEDLMRRDFTVNAMAYNPDTGLCDPFGGSRDAKDRLIRAVGDPYRRFDEDALRILRALRFASVLGFEIEERTAKAVRELAPRLSSISKERIYTELRKLIMGDGAVKILMEYSDVIAPLFLDLKIEKLPKKELFDRADEGTRFASLFILNSPSPVSHSYAAFTDLKTDKLTRTRVSRAIEVYREVTFVDVRAALTHLADYGLSATSDALALGILTEKFGVREADALEDALRSGVPYNISSLALNGDEVASLGIKGERIGKALKSLLYAVIDGKTENKKDALISYLKSSD